MSRIGMNDRHGIRGPDLKVCADMLSKVFYEGNHSTLAQEVQ